MHQKTGVVICCLFCVSFELFSLHLKPMIFMRNVMCSDIKADAGCLAEKGLYDTWWPMAAPGLRAPVELWRSSQTPAVLRASIRYRLPVNNSCVIFLTGPSLPGNLCRRRFPLFVLIPFQLHCSIWCRCAQSLYLAYIIWFSTEIKQFRKHANLK